MTSNPTTTSTTTNSVDSSSLLLKKSKSFQNILQQLSLANSQQSTTPQFGYGFLGTSVSSNQNDACIQTMGLDEPTNPSLRHVNGKIQINKCNNPTTPTPTPTTNLNRSIYKSTESLASTTTTTPFNLVDIYLDNQQTNHNQFNNYSNLQQQQQHFTNTNYHHHHQSALSPPPPPLLQQQQQFMNNYQHQPGHHSNLHHITQTNPKSSSIGLNKIQPPQLDFTSMSDVTGTTNPTTTTTSTTNSLSQPFRYIIS